METIVIVLLVLFLLGGGGLGIFALAALTWVPDKHVHVLFDPFAGCLEEEPASNSIW
jgi:hypothetical protein